MHDLAWNAPNARIHLLYPIEIIQNDLSWKEKRYERDTRAATSFKDTSLFHKEQMPIAEILPDMLIRWKDFKSEFFKRQNNTDYSYHNRQKEKWFVTFI